MITNTFDPLSILNGREKRLNGWSYKLLPSGGQYGLDVVVEAEPEVNESEMSFWLPYADGNRRDGVGDLLDVEGIRTERHRMNPLTLFDHAKAVVLPLGKNQDEGGTYYNLIDPISRTARAKVFVYQGGKASLKQDEGPSPSLAGLSQKDLTEHSKFCLQVFDLWRQKFVRSGSIGYQVVHAKQLSPDYETGTPQGLHLMVVNKLENSVVVLPANQDTTRKSFRHDPVREILAMPRIAGMPASPWLVKSLTPYAGPAPEMVTGGFVGVKSNPMERKFSGSQAVPHGDHSATSIPPPKMRPGWVQVVKNIRLGLRAKAAPKPPKKGPYEDGYQARIRNDGSDKNPHAEGHADRDHWQRGWTAADADLAKKQPPQGGTKALPPAGGQPPPKPQQPAQPKQPKQQYPVAAPHTPPPGGVPPKQPKQDYPVAEGHKPPPQAKPIINPQRVQNMMGAMKQPTPLHHIRNAIRGAAGGAAGAVGRALGGLGRDAAAATSGVARGVASTVGDAGAEAAYQVGQVGQAARALPGRVAGATAELGHRAAFAGRVGLAVIRDLYRRAAGSRLGQDARNLPKDVRAGVAEASNRFGSTVNRVIGRMLNAPVLQDSGLTPEQHAAAEQLYQQVAAGTMKTPQAVEQIAALFGGDRELAIQWLHARAPRADGKSLPGYDTKAAKRGSPGMMRPTKPGKQSRVRVNINAGEVVMVVRNIFGDEEGGELFARPRDMVTVLDDPYGEDRHGTFHAQNKEGDIKEVSVADVRKIQGRMQKQPRPQVQGQAGQQAPKPADAGGPPKAPTQAERPPHFNGVITTVDGRKVRYVDGKPVKMQPGEKSLEVGGTKALPKGKPRRHPGMTPPISHTTTGGQATGAINRPGSKLLEIRRQCREAAKGFRVRLRKGVPGNTLVYVAGKDLSALQAAAAEKGIKVANLGQKAGLEKVKLTGDDGACDALAKRFGSRPRKRWNPN